MLSHLCQSGACTFLESLTAPSRTGLAVGALVGLGLGVHDYLELRRHRHEPLDNVVSVMFPTYLCGALGSMPYIGVPVAMTAFVINEQEKQREHC